LRRVAEHLAQSTNSHAHHRITHGSLGPDRVQDLVFGDQAVWVLHQVLQYSKGFGCQDHGFRIAPQTGVLRV
jgi:hypothetical protein